MADSVRGQIDRVLRLAEEVGGTLGGQARAATTLARERTTLRLFDITGLDRSGVPLASAVVERAIGEDPALLARGIALPFAIALLEYDVSPHQLALDVASGAVDLAFEAKLLEDPQRREAAAAEASRLLDRAAERIDANRVARLELLAYFGDAPRPWQAAALGPVSLETALAEVPALVAGGADVIRVTVPPVRELVAHRHDPGHDAYAWRSRRPAGPGPEHPADIPAGSQRGIAGLRRRLDEAGAEGGRSIRLATNTDALAAPEQALVAALERVDMVEADPVTEVVAGGADPDRALADHSFAHRLLRRAGVQVIIGPGPLVVAPDLARGLPASPTTRAGRAFALQALAVAIARVDGLDSRQLAAGALPGWLADERDPVTQAMAAVAIRRLAWPDMPLVFEEPAGSIRLAARWPHLLAFGLGIAGESTLVARPGDFARDRSLAEGTRAAVAVGQEIMAAPGAVLERPLVAGHASALLAAAAQTLEGLRDEGWGSVLATRQGDMEVPRLGAGAVARRVGSDPVEALLSMASG